MDPSVVFTWLQNTFQPVLGMLDVSSGIDARAALLIFLLIMVAEANLAVPMLIESVWLIVGFHSGFEPGAVMNAVALLLIAQVARQAGIFSIFKLFPFINRPLSSLYMRPLRRTRLYRKYAGNDYIYNARFLSLPSATLGMMTPLCSALKVFLILKRKRSLLLLGTLFSGLAFDICYVVLGATFHTTRLNMAYLPAFLAVGFLILVVMRLKARNGLRENVLRKEVP